VKAGETASRSEVLYDVSMSSRRQIKAGVEAWRHHRQGQRAVIGPVGAIADKQISEARFGMSRWTEWRSPRSAPDALSPGDRRIIAAGMPVVAFNDNPASKRLVFAGQDLVAAGPRGRQAHDQDLGGRAW